MKDSSVSFNINSAGFSLIELIGFILIVSVFTAASLRLLHYQTSLSQKPMLQSMLITEAQHYLDAMSHLSYDELVIGKHRQQHNSIPVEFVIDVSYAGEQFSLPHQQVKNITITANNQYNHSIVSSSFKFNYPTDL